MSKGNKVYLGTHNNAIIAALLYDIATLQTKGVKAKLNFEYTSYEIMSILLRDPIINVKQ